MGATQDGGKVGMIEASIGATWLHVCSWRRFAQADQSRTKSVSRR